MEKWLAQVESLPAGHPIKVYIEEGHLIKSLLEDLQARDPEVDFEGFYNPFNQFREIEKRFKRKENQLFPYLEKHGWTGPSQGMWAFHDALRAQIKACAGYLEAREFEEFKQEWNQFIPDIFRLLMIEDHKLFPTSFELLSEDDWKEFYEGDEEIGWMLEKAPPVYPPYVHPSQDTQARVIEAREDAHHYDEGYLTPDQVNLIFKFLPVDITYVDENDKVAFYNRGDERVFARSKGIIGREVKFCHPPKSVDMVLKIVEEFRAGNKDVADFWIDMGPKKIHIRYFAVRDPDGTYRGVLEMSQDITEIQQIEGQKRLLDWE